MTLIQNPITEKQLRARSIRVGWWRWVVDGVHPPGARMEMIDLATMKPALPAFMVEGRNYDQGTFVGWVDTVEHRALGLSVVKGVPVEDGEEEAYRQYHNLPKLESEK